MTNEQSFETVATPEAPAAVGPYSQALISSDLIFCSGQIHLDPETGELVGSSPSEWAERVLQNLGSVLAAAGATLADITKMTVYLCDAQHFAEVNQVYEAVIPHKPARTTVVVAGLPLGAQLEIECIARMPVKSEPESD